jgi:hypothetical protein
MQARDEPSKYFARSSNFSPRLDRLVKWRQHPFCNSGEGVTSLHGGDSILLSDKQRGKEPTIKRSKKSTQGKGKGLLINVKSRVQNKVWDLKKDHRNTAL